MRPSPFLRAAAGLIGALALLAGCTDTDGREMAVGLLESDRIELRADAAEPVTRILVTEGQQVAAGQVLLQQDGQRSAARLIEARARLAETEAALAEQVRGPRRETIEAAQASLAAGRRDRDFRQLELDRLRRLLARNLTSQDSVDRAQAAYDLALAEVDVRAARLEELRSGTTEEELAQARERVVQAQAQLQRLQVDDERLTVRAPAAGLVDTILIEPGERPAQGQPLLVLLTGSQPHARVYVPAALRVGLAPGAAASVAIQGVAAPVRGQVRRIASDSSFTPYFALTRHDRGRLSYVAEITLPGDEPRWPDGAAVEVTFAPGDASGLSGD